MTNTITAVMLDVFSLPRTMFYVVIKQRVFEGRLCRPITFGNDGIMDYQWKKLYKMRPLQSLWYAQLVIKCNIRGAKRMECEEMSDEFFSLWTTPTLRRENRINHCSFTGFCRDHRS